MPALSTAIQCPTRPQRGPASSALTNHVEERPSRRGPVRESPATDETMAGNEGCAIGRTLRARVSLFWRATREQATRCRPTQGVPMMKSFPAFAIIIVAGLVSACTYRHETVERPAAPAATVVATPVPASNTVVYSDPAPASTTTVYTR